MGQSGLARITSFQLGVGFDRDDFTEVKVWEWNWGSVQGLAWHGGAVEGFTGGDDSEIEFLQEFLGIVALDRVLRWLVDGRDLLQSLAHDFKGSRIHKCRSFRREIVRPWEQGGKAL